MAVQYVDLTRQFFRPLEGNEMHSQNRQLFAKFCLLSLSLASLSCSAKNLDATSAASPKPLAAPSKEIMQQVQPPTEMKHRLTKYSFEIGNPRGFRIPWENNDCLVWRGDSYKSAKNVSILREFRVCVRKIPEGTTVEQALQNAFDGIAAEHVECKRRAAAGMNFGELNFLRCDYDFTNELRGHGTGFL